MANSAEIKLKATLDASDAKAEAQRLKETLEGTAPATNPFAGAADGASDALAQASNNASRLNDNLDKTAAKASAAKISISALVAATGALADAGSKLYSSYLRKQGRDDEADAVEKIGGGAVQTGARWAAAGAAAGLYAGPTAAAVLGIGGAVAGGAVGAVTGKMNLDTERADAAQQAVDEFNANTEAAEKALSELDDMRTEAAKLKSLFGVLSDTSADSEQKTRDLNMAIADYSERVKRQRFELEGPELQQNPAQYREMFQSYVKNLNTLEGLQDKLNELKTSTSGAADGGEARTRESVDALTKIGGSIGGGSDSVLAGLQQQSVDIAKQQLETLRAISYKTGGATWQ